VECFGHRIYLLIFAAYALSICAGAANVFGVFFRRDQLGLSLDQIGKLAAYVGMACVFLTYPMVILVDRFGCNKSLISSWFATALFLIAGFFCVHDYWTLFDKRANNNGFTGGG
jgi:nitrate/nitrite transporter NarK